MTTVGPQAFGSGGVSALGSAGGSGAFSTAGGGRLMGLVVRASAFETKLLPASEFFIGLDAVMATGSGPFPRRDLRALLRGNFDNVSGLIGTDLLAADGTALGRVADVYVDERRPRVAYRIVENLWQRLFGGGYYLPGAAPTVYSPDGTRFIAPADTKERLAARTPREALEAGPAPPRRPKVSQLPSEPATAS